MAAMVTTGAVATSLERFEPRAGRPDREAARIRAAKLFDQHGALIQRICRHLLRDDFEAEDAAQQTFLSAYKALLGGAAPRDGEAWLATIARHECLQRIRVRMRLPLPVLDVELEDHRSNVHQLVLDRAAAARLWREIRRLPQQQRDAVLLREIAGLSYEELGVLLGVTQPAVESLLFRARAQLRDRLRAAAASLNVVGLASEAAAALARLAAPGAAPLAVKAAAMGVGVAVVGGGGIVAERGLELRPATAAQSSRAAADATRRTLEPARHRVLPAPPTRLEPHATLVAHPASAAVPVRVERRAGEHHQSEHHEREQHRSEHRERAHHGSEARAEAPRQGDDGNGERGEGATTTTTTAAPLPPERHDEGGEGPSITTTTPVARDTGTSGEGGREGPGTTVAAPSSSGDGSSGDRDDATEGGSAAIVESGGDDGGGDDAVTMAATTTTTTTSITTATTTTATGDGGGGESGSTDGSGHSGPH